MPAENQVKIIRITREQLVTLLPGVPKGAELVAVCQADTGWDSTDLAIKVRHNSYLPVAEGELIPVQSVRLSAAEFQRMLDGRKVRTKKGKP